MPTLLRWACFALAIDAAEEGDGLGEDAGVLPAPPLRASMALRLDALPPPRDDCRRECRRMCCVGEGRTTMGLSPEPAPVEDETTELESIDEIDALELSDEMEPRLEAIEDRLPLR